MTETKRGFKMFFGFDSNSLHRIMAGGNGLEGGSIWDYLYSVLLQQAALSFKSSFKKYSCDNLSQKLQHVFKTGKIVSNLVNAINTRVSTRLIVDVLIEELFFII